MENFKACVPVHAPCPIIQNWLEERPTIFPRDLTEFPWISLENFECRFDQNLWKIFPEYQTVLGWVTQKKFQNKKQSRKKPRTIL